MADKILDTWNDYNVCPTCANAWFNGIDDLGSANLTPDAERWILDHRGKFTLEVVNDLAHYAVCDVCSIETCVFPMNLHEWDV